MKTLKKTVSAVLLLCLLAAMLSVGAWADGGTVSGPASVTVGEEVTYTASFDPPYNGEPVTWYLDPNNNDYLDYVCESGNTLTLRGKAAGNVTVGATYGGNSAELSVSVSAAYDPPLPQPYFEISAYPTTVEAGNSGVITFSVANARDMDGYSYSWSIGGNAIGTFVNGVTTGSTVSVAYSGDGTSYVYATASNGVSSVNANNNGLPITVTPRNVLIDSISINNPGSVYIGEQKTMTAAIQPNNASNKTVLWSSNVPAIAEIDENTGVITPKMVGGPVIITARATDGSGKYATYSLNVLDSSLKIESSNRNILKVGEVTSLSMSSIPNGTLSKWEFTNSTYEQYASLSSATTNPTILKALKVGTVEVRATDTYGKSATYTIQIVGNDTPSSQYTLSDYNVTLTKGSTKQLSAKLSGNDVTIGSGWLSSNNSVAQVVNGKITAVGVGNARITASFVYNGTTYTADSYVTVVAPNLVHTIVYGNYSTFDGKNALSFITNDSHYNFTGVYVDGAPLTNGVHYIEQSSPNGYIQVLLNPQYLAYLSSSNYHTIQIGSSNGTATGYFRNYGVSYNIYGVRTGDDSNIGLWAALCLISFAGAAAIIIRRRKDITG